MSIASDHRHPYLSLGFGPSLFAVATVRGATRNAEYGRLPEYGVNLSIKPALPSMNDRGELLEEISGIHHLEVALISETPRPTRALLEMVCEPAGGRPFDIQLSPCALVGHTPDAAQFDTDVILDPGTYHFLVIVERHARADFLIEV
jgi:hypothetical protein